MKTNSDTLYKQLFAHPEIVRDLLAGFLRADWARALEVDAFERVNASYVSDSGKARHGDVVWRARIGGEWVYVYILLEFQTRPDRWMALRMQVYVGLLYQDLVAQRRLSKHGKLPPILPIVLYRGRKPWNAATVLADLMLPAPDGLQHLQAQQKYLLIDQHHCASVDERGNVVAILFSLMRSRTDAEMRAALDLFNQRMRAPDMRAARDNLIRWLGSTLQEEFSETSMSLEEELNMLFDKKFKRYEDLLEYEAINKGRLQGLEEGRREGRQEGHQEGLQQGLRQGLQEGLQEGHKQALQDLLQEILNGDSIPPDVSEKISAAEPEQLRAWIKSLSKGAKLRQLFAGA
jgi:predicted transposase/invertase (TIGR01784 family)